MDFGKKRFGFGCMRLPMVPVETGFPTEVDIEQTIRMVDRFMEEGFNYFDTAHGYLGGKSELALREALTSRYPRDSYILTNKLSGGFFKSRAEIRPLVDSQLDACGVEYFDYLLMHAMTATEYAKYKACEAFEEVKLLHSEGKCRHIGISFHDSVEVLEQILTEHPEIEVVQIQFNYVDLEDPVIQSRKVYEVCAKHGKPVLVMEPIKGGALVNLPAEAAAQYDALGENSYASYALRFVAGYEQVAMILSGMSTPEQMEDNLKYMKDVQPLSKVEAAAVAKVSDFLRHQDTIPCTACRYCVDGCPQHILIPDLFACMNAKTQFKDWNSDFYYGVASSSGHGKASDCVECGQCEQACPQHLEIRELLKKVATTFEQ